MNDPMVDEFLKLLGLATAYMTAAEDMIAGLQGKLEVATPGDINVVSQAAMERVRAYLGAKREFRRYAAEKSAELERATVPDPPRGP